MNRLGFGTAIHFFVDKSLSMNQPTPAPPLTLKRSIGLLTAIVFVISAVIGTGIFKKIAPMSAELGSPGLVLLAWALAGTVSLIGTLSNAEVAGMLADSGGEYAYFKVIYNRFFAFLLGWTNFAVIRTASIASIAYVFAQSLNSIFPLPVLWPEGASVSVLGLHLFDNLTVKLVGIGLIISLTWVNHRGIKTGEAVSRALTALMLLTILAIIVLGLTSSVGSWQNLTTTANAPATGSVGLSGGALISGLGVACLGAFWAYEGWNNLGYIGGELKNPQRNLPLALAIGTLLIMGLYLLLNTVYLYVLPIDRIIDIHRQQNGIVAVIAVQEFLGRNGALLVSCLILVTTFNCTISTVLMASRLTYAMALDGLFFKGVERLHPRYGGPSNALWAQGAWASLLVLSGTFDQLTDMLIFASFIFYGATTLGVFILRVKHPDWPRTYRVIGYPVTPALFLLFCTALIVSTLKNRTDEAFAGLALMATGVPFYWFWNRKLHLK
jgi:basic amino acid/polyamine antiporter, APA family